MGVQSGINRLIGTISFGAAAVSRVAAGLKEAAAKASAAAMEKAKQGYEKSASIKAQNKKIEKSYADLLNSTMPGVKDSKTKAEKVKQPEVLESSMKPAVYEKLLPQPKQKFILSEEGAEYPTIKADASTTGIDAKDEDVATLMQVKQKNINRIMGGQKAWETRLNKTVKLSGMTGEQYLKSGMSFKELEKKNREHFESFTPMSPEDAKQLGVSMDSLRLTAAKAENGEGVGIESVFKDLRNHFKNDEAALKYLDDKWNSVFANETADSYIIDSAGSADLMDEWNTLTKDLISGKYKEMYDPEVMAQKEMEYFENADKRAEDEAIKNRLDTQYAEMLKKQEENKDVEKAKQLEEYQEKLKALPEIPDYDKLKEEVRTKDTFKGYKIGKPINSIGGGQGYDRSKLNFSFSTISDAEKEKLQKEFENFNEKEDLQYKINSLTKKEKLELSSSELESWQKLLAERQSKQTEIEEPEVKEDDKYSV